MADERRKAVPCSKKRTVSRFRLSSSDSNSVAVVPCRVENRTRPWGSCRIVKSTHWLHSPQTPSKNRIGFSGSLMGLTPKRCQWPGLLLSLQGCYRIPQRAITGKIPSPGELSGWNPYSVWHDRYLPDRLLCCSPTVAVRRGQSV